MKIAKTAIGNIVYYVGLLSLPLGVGAALGFYAGAWGMRWLPTMLEIFLGICIFSLAAIIIGRAMEGSAIVETKNGVRLRKRVITAIIFICIMILSRLGVYWVKQPSPLTELSPENFEEVFQVDMQNYFEYDRAIDELINRLEKYEQRFGDDKTRILKPDEEKMFRDIWTTIYDYAFAIDQIRIFYEDWYRFDPSRAQCSYHHRSFLLTFAAELSLYEKGFRFINLVTPYENAIKFLNTPCPQAMLEANSFSKFQEDFNGIRDHARIVAGKKYLLWMAKALKGREVIKQQGCSELWDKAEYEIAAIEKTTPLERIGLTVKSDFKPLKRKISRTWFKGQKDVATWMGNTRIKRIGKYLIDEQTRQQMVKQLAPGDILISRKNWYLSNVGLPGFWPHAILYIGSPAKFEEYFDDSEVQEYINKISGQKMTLGQYLDKMYPSQWLSYQLGRAGKDLCVIEGLSPGVIFNTMKETCGDYMAAIRPRLSKKAKAQAIITSFSHQGKPYDYNFDFATDHALVCTELVWRSYRQDNGKKGLNIPLVEIAGRKTLPANEIAKLFAAEHGQADSQLEFIFFVDAIEKTQKPFLSTEQEFLSSCQRSKWSILQN